MNGIEGSRSQRLPNRISYRLDPEVSPPHPESWRAWVSPQTFSEGDEADAWMRDRESEYPGRSYPHADHHSAEVRGERSDGDHQRDDEQPPSEKVRMAGESLLERKYCMVTGVLCSDRGNRRGQDLEIRGMAGTPGFRSSEA